MLKKKNLVEVAVHFGITLAVGATKSHILDLIENYCVDNVIIDEIKEKPIAENEVLKLKLVKKLKELAMPRKHYRMHILRMLIKLAKQRKLKHKKLES